MSTRSCYSSLTARALRVTGLLLVLSLIGAVIGAASPVGQSENGILQVQWKYTLKDSPVRMVFGASAGIANLGPDVNQKGSEPDDDLEIVTGSDELCSWHAELARIACGIWRCFDSQGNVEWATATETDQARSSVAIIDLNNDRWLDIAGGTTSGWNVEVMDRYGKFVWTFPLPPEPPDISGPFMWHSSPAVCDVDPEVSGLEVIIGNRHQFPDQYPGVWAFDGDNSDGVDDGNTIRVTHFPTPAGIEGIDWDVLWVFEAKGSVISTPAIGDIDNDGRLEVAFGAGYDPPPTCPEDREPCPPQSADGRIYVLDGNRGTCEWVLRTGGSFVEGSAGLADFDNDGDLEVIIGSSDQRVYFINGDENNNGMIGSSEVAKYKTEGSVYSSPAIGDVDADGDLEVIIGSNDGGVYSFDYDPKTNTVTLNWVTMTGGPIYSSPALADRGIRDPYYSPWPMFRSNPQRTGLYQRRVVQGLDIYVGSVDGYIYLLRGRDGAVIDRFKTGGAIYTSPSVADVDGDGRLEIFLYDYGQDEGGSDVFWAIEDLGT